MTQYRKVLAWGGAVVGGVASVGLLVLLVAGELDTADQIASVAGAVIGLVSLGVSVYALKRPAPEPESGTAAVANGDRAVAVAGSITGDVSTGDRRSTVPRSGRRARSVPQARPAAPGGTAQAAGERSVAVRGDVTGSVSTGDSTPEARSVGQ